MEFLTFNKFIVFDTQERNQILLREELETKAQISLCMGTKP